MKPELLRCEYLVEPQCLDEKQPRLSWENKSEKRGVFQTAYRIVVADSQEQIENGTGNIWDSGMVQSDESMVVYRGGDLQEHQSYFWRVQTWNNLNPDQPEWSNTATWSMGFLNQDNWQGNWIGYPVAAIRDCVVLRKEFELRKAVSKARIYFTARGVINTWFNGRMVNDKDCFVPGWTDYNKRFYYQGYDVTEQLVNGSNTVSCMIAEGWYKGTIGGSCSLGVFGHWILALINLVVEYEDGTSETFATDSTWKSAISAISFSTFYEGERCDGRMNHTDWSNSGFDDSSWEPVTVQNYSYPEGKYPALQAYPCEPVRRLEEISAIDMWETAPGSFVYDLGQNFAGRVRIKVSGKPGTVLQLRHGEMVNPDKTLYVTNLRSAYSVDTYIIKGDIDEIWEPAFTFHGFRYVELTGYDKPELDTVTGVVLGSATRRVGHFECSNELVNQLYSNVVWTQVSNFLDVPTDCPQRDERLGWTGDAQAYIRTAIANMDVAAFFKKWFVDLVDSQNEQGAYGNIAPRIKPDGCADAAWGDAGTICPWTIYQCYGDKRELEKMYPSMKEWVNYLHSTSEGFIRSQTKCFGDWLSINAETPKEVIQTAFFAYSTKLTADTARVLGMESEADEYDTLEKNIKKAFIEKYVDEKGDVYGQTQTAYLLALKFDLVPNELRPNTEKLLIDNIRKNDSHLSTGFVGTPYLLPELSKMGQHDLAYQLLLNETYPSWLYSVLNGATTIWERWNGWKKDEGCGNANMNSFSHYAYGSVGEWMFSTMAGIDVKEPGFKTIKIRPVPGGNINSVNARYHSMKGMIVSSWEIKNDTFHLDVTIPANTHADIVIPNAVLEDVTEGGEAIKEGQNGVISVQQADNGVVLQVGSGSYEFESLFPAR